MTTKPTVPVIESQTNPVHAHDAHIAALAESFGNTPVYQPPPPEGTSPIIVPATAGDGGTASAPEAQGAVDAPTNTQVAKPANAASIAPKPDKLARSMEIQRRAEAATRRARTEASKLRTPAPAPKAEKPAPQADPQVDNIRAQLEAEVRFAKTDPLGFARKHGVTGAALAEYVKQGTDPTARAVELLRQDAAKAIAQVEHDLRAEYDQKLGAIQSTIVQDQETRAQTNFFTFIEEAKDQNPDAFKAIGSGLLYSENELWNKANEVLTNRPDLQKDFDEDKLLEAVEVEARKDPRWSRLETLLNKEKSTSPSNAAPKSEKSNVSAKVETPAADPAPEPQRATQPRERDSRGQYTENRRSPFEDHQKHVETVLGRIRFGG